MPRITLNGQPAGHLKKKKLTSCSLWCQEHNFNNKLFLGNVFLSVTVKGLKTLIYYFFLVIYQNILKGLLYG